VKTKIILILATCFSFLKAQGDIISLGRSLSDTIPVLIPEPREIIWKPNLRFCIDANTKIVVTDPADTAAANALKKEIIASCALSLRITNTLVASNSIILQRWAEPSVTHPVVEKYNQQAYILDVKSTNCVITGEGPDGVFYGAMTLKQLIKQHEGNCLHGVVIYDYPNLDFRGTRMHFKGSAQWLDSMKNRVDYFASLKLNKLILESADLYTNENAAAIDNLFRFCRKTHIEPIPLLQSFGHAGNILLQNPACGEGVFRRNEQFCFLNDTATCIEDTSSFAQLGLSDTGFEDTKAHDFGAWHKDAMDAEILPDSVNKHAGEKCVMINNARFGTSRLRQDVLCAKNTLYSLSFHVCTQDVRAKNNESGDSPTGAGIEIYGYEGSRGWQLLARSYLFDKTQNWRKCSVIFNSAEHEMLRIYVGLYNTKGKAWFDGARIPILKNAEFEEPIRQHWRLENVGKGIDITRNSTSGRFDKSSCKITVDPKIYPSGLYTRLYQDVEVEQGYDYRIKAWVKTEEISGRGCFVTAFWLTDDGRQYWKHRRAEFYDFLMSDTIAGTTDWTAISTPWFSSGGCRKIRVKLALHGIGVGYFDAVRIERVQNHLENVDFTSPVFVMGESGMQYEENVDYTITHRTKLKFPYDIDAHPSYLTRTYNSNIRDSQIVNLSYTKLPAFQHRRDKYGYCYCPVKPETRQLMDGIIKDVLKWNPETIHFGHDEINLMKTDYYCLKTTYTRAGLLAYDVNQLHKTITPVRMILWEDMFNPYHNGHFFPDDPTYPAIDSIGKDIIMAIWFYRKDEPLTLGDSSIAYFGSKGFKTIAAAAGYTPVNPYNWAQEIKHRWVDLGDSSCIGLINTTWVHTWDFNSSLWVSLPLTLEYAWQWPDTATGRQWGKLRYDPLQLHRNYGDVFVPRPSGLECEHIGTRLTKLTWRRNSNRDLKGYNIYRDFTHIASTTDTFYVDHKSPGTGTYHITATDMYNNESVYSRGCIVK
jgi:hypothetical protein